VTHLPRSAIPAFSPARHEGQRIFRQHVDDEGSLDALLLRVDENSQWIDSGGDQAITLDRDPLVDVRGSIVIDPLRLSRAITRRDHPRRRVPLESIRETQHFLLHCRREAADLSRMASSRLMVRPYLRIRGHRRLEHFPSA
jgi:hypothetical protein